MPAFDPTTLVMVAALALLVLVMVRNSRKQKADRESMQSKIVKGATVMTTSGIFGTVVSVDDAENETVIESTPGTKLRVHRQAIANVVEKVAAPEKVADKATTKASTKAPAKKSAAK